MTIDTNYAYSRRELIEIRDAALSCHRWVDLIDPDTGDHVDETDADWSQETLDSYLATVEEFVTLAGDDLDGLSLEQVGHDFALTRNHHGAGFWDRGLGERGERLMKVARSFGSFHPFLSDTNEIEGE